MTVQAISAALARTGLTPSEKLVLIVLANYADHALKCWPSQARLARDTSMSERNMVRVFAGLEAKGVITREGRGRRQNGARTSAMITLHLHADNLAPRTTIHSDKVAPDIVPNCPNQHDKVSPKPSLEPKDEPSTRARAEHVEGSPSRAEMAEQMRALAAHLAEGKRKQ